MEKKRSDESILSSNDEGGKLVVWWEENEQSLREVNLVRYYQAKRWGRSEVHDVPGLLGVLSNQESLKLASWMLVEIVQSS